MDLHLIPALAVFAFVTSITPGPNNLMLMASGANYGFRRTVPHMLGVALGFVAMMVIVGLGLFELFESHPAIRLALKIVSVVYLFYLAWRIAHATPPGAHGEDSRTRPLTFLEAAAFQWVNPKAWAMALTALSVYTVSEDLPDIAIAAAVFGAVNLPSVGSWTLLGQGLRRVLADPVRLRRFNVLMAVLLIASLLPVLIDGN